jgi:hypothetical protein
MGNGKQPIKPINYDAAYSSYGLTKREYFSGLALQGWIACQSETFRGDAHEAAKRAVEYTDALLAELEKTNQQEQ